MMDTLTLAMPLDDTGIITEQPIDLVKYRTIVDGLLGRGPGMPLVGAERPRTFGAAIHEGHLAIAAVVRRSDGSIALDPGATNVLELGGWKQFHISSFQRLLGDYARSVGVRECLLRRVGQWGSLYDRELEFKIEATLLLSNQIAVRSVHEDLVEQWLVSKQPHLPSADATYSRAQRLVLCDAIEIAGYAACRRRLLTYANDDESVH